MPNTIETVEAFIAATSMGAFGHHVVLILVLKVLLKDFLKLIQKFYSLQISIFIMEKKLMF